MIQCYKNCRGKVKIQIRNNIKILLINDKKELLLTHVSDPKTTSKDGSYYGKFWVPIGGDIEEGESIMEAAIRELKEETGLDKKDVAFGPIVWFGEFEMVISGKLIRLKQQFIVAHTTNKSVTMEYLTADEQKVIEKIEWLSLYKICASDEVVYPVVFKDYLPDILNENYPVEPIWIDLAKKPKKNCIFNQKNH